MKTEFQRSAGRRAFLTLVAALAGGSTFTSCDSKIKNAVVGGLETTFLSLFDPSTYLDDFSGFQGGGLLDQ